MPKFEDVGGLLRSAREKMGLSQEQFATTLQIKVSRLQKWESGANQPRFSIPELRRLRNLNREIFDALMTGFLLAPASFLGFDPSRSMTPRLAGEDKGTSNGGGARSESGKTPTHPPRKSRR